MDGTAWVAIGQITAPHGVRGAVRVWPLSDFPERWRGLEAVHLGRDPAGEAPEARRVEWTEIYGHFVLVKLVGTDDRDAAERLRDLVLFVPREAAWPLPEGRHYVFELVGLPVFDRQGRQRGRLVDVESGPAHDLLVVEDASGRRWRVPAVRELVSIDRAAGKIELEPLEGLLPPEGG